MGSKFASEYISTNQRQLEPCPDRKDGANAAIPYERHTPFRAVWHAHLSSGIKLQLISFRDRRKQVRNRPDISRAASLDVDNPTM